MLHIIVPDGVFVTHSICCTTMMVIDAANFTEIDLMSVESIEDRQPVKTSMVCTLCKTVRNTTVISLWYLLLS